MTRKDASPEEKAKHAAVMREWRAKNPERWKEIAGPARKKWKTNNRDAHREAQRNHRDTLRREILDLLGGQKCIRCGFTDWRALQVDHINGDGCRDQRFKSSGTGPNYWSFRAWLMLYPEKAKLVYQILCANCNWIKRYENGEHGYLEGHKKRKVDKPKYGDE